MQKLKKIVYAFRFYFYNSYITHFPSYKLRHWYLCQILGYKIHKSSAVHMGCFFTGAFFTMQRHSVINRNCYLDCREGIVIGENVSISPECYLLTWGHDPQSPVFNNKAGKVLIENYAWLGARVLILPGITIKEGTVAAAGSIVAKNFPAYSIIGGNPARFIKERNRDLAYRINWFPWFDTDIL